MRKKVGIELNATPETVFAHVDNIANAGWHMMKSSMPLMGSKLSLEVVSKNRTGVGATYRWYGKVAGLPIDFAETVTKWEENREKVWRTIGDPKIIIMSHYEMRFLLEKTAGNQTRLTYEIVYDLPKSPFWKAVGLLLAGWYSSWCFKRMCQDTRRAVESAAE